MDEAVLLDGTTRVPLTANEGTYLAGGDTGDYNGDGHQDAVLAGPGTSARRIPRVFPRALRRQWTRRLRARADD